MADGGGNFGGDGSVNWTIITGKEKDNSHDCKKNGKRRHCYGVDDDFGPNFRVTIEVPTDDRARAAFIAALQSVTDSDNEVNFEIPIKEKHDRQIVIRWGTSASADPTST